MKRIILLLTLSIFLISCTKKENSNEKLLKLEDEKKITVNFEEKIVRKNERILVLDYQIDERILREEIVEKQVLEIWKNFEDFANEKEFEEGLIISKYFVGKDEKNGEPIYESFLFNTEKIENGTWKIRKVN